MANHQIEFIDSEPVNQVPTNVVLPVIYREKLRFLARKTRVPQAEFIREAVRDLLGKYRHLLEGIAPSSDTLDRK